MKKSIAYCLFLVGGISFAQVPCNNGTAAGFPCENFDYQDQVSLSAMSAGDANDSWGWTDPLDGKEYAIIGLNNGTGFADISDPVSYTHLTLPTTPYV